MAQAVKNSSTDPIIGSYDILAIKKRMVEERNSLCDRYDSTFEADANFFFGSKTIFVFKHFKRPFFVQKISSYPINTEIKTVKTFATTPNLISLSPAPRIGTNLPSALDSVLTVELNTSMIALPKCLCVFL
jgi:hypothetical protein